VDVVDVSAGPFCDLHVEEPDESGGKTAGAGGQELGPVRYDVT